MNTQIPKITINGKEVELEPIPNTSSTVKKFRELVKQRYYQVVKINEQTQYGDYIVTIKDLDEESELKVFMPERLKDNIYPGTVFVYNGMKPLKDGHTYHGQPCHNVVWFKCKQ